MIEATPAGNGDITSLLRTNPAVKFSNTNRQSTTMGEIDPADISINGARHYQNNFMIDGININNDLDPGGKKVSDNFTISDLTIAGSASQGVAIDSDFIESIDVYDSDISAKYGNFTGGVVEAKTRNPREGFHGKFSTSYTSSKWTKYIIDEADANALENSTSADFQPEFTKWRSNLNLEGFLTDDFGLMFGYSNTRSKIPLKGYEGKGFTQEYQTLKRKQTRKIENYFLKGVWYANDRLTLTPSITYAPQENKIFRQYNKDSFMIMKSGGLNLALSADYESDIAKISQSLSYSILQTSRDAENEYFYTWKNSNIKNWDKSVPSEGGYGDLEQKQKTFNYKLDLSFNELETSLLSHKFIAGLDFKRQSANFSVAKEYVLGALPASLKNNTCEAGDKLCIKDSSFGGKGQYLVNKNVYNGSIDVSLNSFGAYLEDTIKFKKLTIRPGIRLDKDNYTNQTTIAPRFSMSYDVFANGDTLITFGKNRYYGRSVFAYKLKDGREALVARYTRDKSNYSTNWKYLKNNQNRIKFSELDVPYDDETSLGITHNMLGLNFGFKYVKREGKKQIIKTKLNNTSQACPAGYNNTCDTYTNGGESEANIYTAFISNAEPFKFLGTNHNFLLSFDKTKEKRNSSNYEDSLSLDEIDGEKQVVYDGNIIDYDMLPRGEFARPWGLKLTTTHHMPNYGLTLSNFFSYTSSQDGIVGKSKVTIDGKAYESYEKVNLGKKTTWDARVSYLHKFPKNISGFINLDINNVLNKSNKLSYQKTGIKSRTTYEAGRQFWLEAGLKW
ncbi:TonB-dependent receptor plug domain-containing protein [Campylobacter mucosalis]|uniref:TonB-dependent receptor plug domain-containing protein n=1 Tax=Campylobacter mucosalis TaxID=202 RepID=UPI0014707824|nr:TonB-dependent receptor plug domain-containing protein [Campylobacter mucosalis]